MTSHQNPERWPSWQAMDSGRLLLLAAAVMLTVAAVARTATAHPALVNPAGQRAAIAFGVLIALGELLRLALPGGREAAPIATATAMAYALLLSIHDVVRAGHVPPPLRISPLQVIAVTAVGMTIGALPHMAAGRPVGIVGMASRLVAVSVVAFSFRPLAHLPLVDRQWWLAAGLMAVLLAFARHRAAVAGRPDPRRRDRAGVRRRPAADRGGAERHRRAAAGEPGVARPDAASRRQRRDQPMTAIRSPSWITSPSATASRVSFPPPSASTGISIFIDSRMTSVSPSSRSSPSAATTFQTFATISARISVTRSSSQVGSLSPHHHHDRSRSITDVS